MNSQQNNSRDLIAGLVAVVVTLGAFDTFQRDLEPVAGYLASVLGGMVISAIIVFVVCLLVRMPRRKAVATALLLPPTLVTFELIRKDTVDITGSGIFSLLLAVVFALMIGMGVAVLARRFAGIDWASPPEPNASITPTPENAEQ